MTYGNGLGQQMGFPTANIAPSHPIDEGVEDGVWAGEVSIGGKHYGSVVNIGYSPSVVTKGSRRIEAHIIDFCGNIYGSPIELTLLHHLRPERKFPSREALVEQIALDLEEAKRLLANSDATK